MIHTVVNSTTGERFSTEDRDEAWRVLAEARAADQEVTHRATPFKEGYRQMSPELQEALRYAVWGASPPNAVTFMRHFLQACGLSTIELERLVSEMCAYYTRYGNDS